MQPAEQDLISRWSGAAPYWEKHRGVIHGMFAPVTQALVEDGRIASGHAVLDIATGPGEPALSVAGVVGPKGRVVGIDPAPEMVAAARRAAIAVGLGNAQFEVGFADHLPLPSESFDAVVSRFGAMFFPSPADAVREILRVLKPGGRLALAVWHFADKNPFLSLVARIMGQYVEQPPVAPDTPDTFRFAERGKLRDILIAAGVAAPTERLLQFNTDVPLSIEDCWTLRCEMSEQLRASLASLSPELVASVKRQSLEAFREYSRDGGMSFPSEVLIVSGAKGRSA